MKTKLLILIQFALLVACSGESGTTSTAPTSGGTVGGNPENAPQLTSEMNQTKDENVAITPIDINDTNTLDDLDRDGDPIVYGCFFDTTPDSNVSSVISCSGINGLIFSAITGSISWTPNFSQSGLYEIKIVGSDGATTDFTVFQIIVSDIDAPPILENIPAQSIIEDSGITTIDANDQLGSDLDADGDPILYTCFYDTVVDGSVAAAATCASLSGASFDTATGIFDWTGQYGVWEFRISGDEGDLNDEKVFVITVDDVTPPQNPTIEANGGDLFTNSTSVSLAIGGTGATEMYITQTSGCGIGGTWEAFSTSKLHTITADSNNIVYLKLRDTALNQSGCVSDSIIHDGQSPSVVTGINNAGNANAINSDTTSWIAQVDNGLSGISSYQLAVSTTTSETNVITNGDWRGVGNVTSHQVVGGLTLSDTGTYYTLLRAIDNAGNVGPYSASASWQPVDTTPPLDPTGWTISSPVDGSTTNDLSPQFDGAAENGSIARIYINDASCAVPSFIGAAIVSGGTFTVSTISLAADGSVDGNNDFYGTLQDIAGNTSNCINLSLGYTLDTQGPIGMVMSIDSGSAYTKSTDVTLTLDSSDGAQMYLTEDPSCNSGGAWEAYVTSKTFTISTTNAVNTIYYKTNDALGNESVCINASIGHDDQAPDAVSGITLIDDATQYYSETTNWTVTSDNGLSGLSHYLFAISTTTSDADIIAGGGWHHMGTNLFYQHKTDILLANGVPYYTILKAVDIAGNESVLSASSSWNVFMAPDQIQNLGTASKSFDRLEMSWIAPFDNLTPVTDYELAYKASASSTWITWDDGVTTDSTEMITGLIEDTNYDFRVRGFNGAWSIWSTIHTDETMINITFFEDSFKAINTGGATASQIVSLVDSNEIKHNGVVIITLNKGEVHPFTSAQFDVIEGTGGLFVAGRRGSGATNMKGNIVWSPPFWAGKSFLFNSTRSAPNIITVYAFQDSTVTITQGGVAIDSQVITESGNHAFSIAAYGSYELNSDGHIVAYQIAAGSGAVTDPKPLLPIAKDIIGVPSRSMQLTSKSDSNDYTYYHSNGTGNSGTIDSGVSHQINPTASRSYYQEDALRIVALYKVTGNSYADANGFCAAPFIAAVMQRKNYGLNVQAEWISFVSTSAAVIDVVDPVNGTSQITLTKSGTNPNSPYKGYISFDHAAGTIFSSTDRFSAWYQPKSDAYGSAEDETVMFGFD